MNAEIILGLLATATIIITLALCRASSKSDKELERLNRIYINVE